MGPILEFLGHKLNGGVNPIGFFLDDPKSMKSELPSDHLRSEWHCFVAKLDAGLKPDKYILLYWLNLFSELYFDRVSCPDCGGKLVSPDVSDVPSYALDQVPALICSECDAPVFNDPELSPV